MPVQLFAYDRQLPDLGISGDSNLWHDGVTGKTNERKPEKVTMAPNVGHEEGVGNLVTSCLDELTTPATAYRKAS